MIHIEFTHPNGRRQTVRKVSPVQTRRGAEAYERQLRNALLTGTYDKEAQADQAPTFRVFAREFQTNYVATNNKPSTQRSKERVLRLHLIPFFGYMRLDAIGPRHIERYKATKLKDYSRKTLNNHLTILRKLLETAREWGLIDKVPSIRWLKAAKPEFRWLDFAEAERLLEASRCEPEWRMMILLGLRTGLRQGELLALRWQDVCFEARRIAVRQAVAEGILGTPKSGRAREVPLSPATLAEFVRHQARYRHLRSPWVFCQLDGDHAGEMLTKGMCKWPLRRARDRADLEALGWHDLRHSFASHLAMRGVPLKAIQELLGHSTIEMTMRYAHLAPSTLIDAVAALDPQQHHDSTTSLLELKTGS
ncbi:site-specific recombinase, phage integrase family protein [Plesiocystis pacifica SIR-1]|uniref:Site-specific recombinase, phage integrase family protein n=2 Tax=Plesiocystis pacifica TaxID=191768 RepID=A6G3J3_9BACT|nr:site-specific recombinase, phage integrase family protein [Plesiocystis pacifica SIR-1]